LIARGGLYAEFVREAVAGRRAGGKLITGHMAESHHEEEVLGKAYDARLMKRLLKYLWPYKWHAVTSLVLTILSAPLVLAGPPLTKAAIDLFLAPDPSKPPSGFALFLKHLADRFGFGASAYQGIAFIALVFFIANVAAFAVHTRKPS